MPSECEDAGLTVENVRLLPTKELQAVIADLLPLLLAARDELDRRSPDASAEAVQQTVRNGAGEAVRFLSGCAVIFGRTGTPLRAALS